MGAGRGAPLQPRALPAVARAVGVPVGSARRLGGSGCGSRAAALGRRPTRVLQARLLLPAPSGPAARPRWPGSETPAADHGLPSEPSLEEARGVLRGSAGAGAPEVRPGKGRPRGWRLGWATARGACLSREAGVGGLEEEEKGFMGLKCNGLKSLWG